MLIPIKIKPGDVLIREGEASDCLYVLKIGTLSVTKFRDGKPTDLGHIVSGETVGEISFLDNKPRSATVKAQSECELIMINRPYFESELARAPELIQTLVKALAMRVRKTGEKLMT